MRFRYSTSGASQNEFDSLPRVPLVLCCESARVEALGLVDSGATINVLPYELGVALGAKWDGSQSVDLACRESRRSARDARVFNGSSRNVAAGTVGICLDAQSERATDFRANQLFYGV